MKEDLMWSECHCDAALIHPPHLLHETKYQIFPLPWNLSHVGSSPLIGRYPTSPEWNNEPIGFQVMKHFVESNSKYNVNIINLAEDQYDPRILKKYAKMFMNEMDQLSQYTITHDISIYADIIDRVYPEILCKIIGEINARLYAVDLHWLVYSHGAIRTLELIKHIHPECHTLVGGLTATYFKHEIMEIFPFIDFLIFGDGSFPLLALLNEINGGMNYSRVPNLLYREENDIRIGQFVPLSDFKYIENHNDFHSTSIQMSRGCPLQCTVCGGSKKSSERLQAYSSISAYSLESIIDKIYFLTNNNSEHANIYFIHDPILTLGMKKWNQLLSEISNNDLKVKLDIEFFMPHSRKDILNIAKKAPGSSIHISPESICEDVRTYHKKLSYSNYNLLRNIDTINDCDDLSMEIWFMAGLAKDSQESINRTLNFIKHYYKKIKDVERMVIKYNEMLFIDPGSIAYDEPEKYGYTLLYRDFKSHRKGFIMPIFKYQINYRTFAFTREDLYYMFLDLHDKINLVYYENNILDDRNYKRIKLYNQLLRKYELEYERADAHKCAKLRERYFTDIGMRFMEDLNTE